MMLETIGRYEVFISQDGTYIVYRQSEDPASASRVVSICDINEVVARRRLTAPVRLYWGDKECGGKTVPEAAETGDVVSTWSIIGVEVDSLFAAGDEGLYLIGDEAVCIATYDLDVAMGVDRGEGAECGIDGFLLKPPFVEHGACGCGRSPA